jgi:hypothetical protein
MQSRTSTRVANTVESRRRHNVRVERFWSSTSITMNQLFEEDLFFCWTFLMLTDEAVNPTLITHSCEVNHENHEIAFGALLMSILLNNNTFSLNMRH